MNLAKKIRSADIYVTGSRYEAGGNHVAEGLSCGLPVIYYKDSGGIKELVQNCGVETNNRNILRSINKIKNNYSSFIVKIKKKYNSNANTNHQYLKIIENYIKISSDNVRIN
jgi:glycosyltransferase involved in cell wall biosynthesis